MKPEEDHSHVTSAELSYFLDPLPLATVTRMQLFTTMGEVNRPVLAPCLLLVGEVAPENLATFAISGLGKFIPEGQ